MASLDELAVGGRVVLDHAGPPLPLRPRVTGIDSVDTAAVDPCPKCGKPVRRMGNIPIAGPSTDPIFSGPWWCADCLKAKCRAAVAALGDARG